MELVQQALPLMGIRTLMEVLEELEKIPKFSSGD